jgi:hypothetical protein
MMQTAKIAKNVKPLRRLHERRAVCYQVAKNNKQKSAKSNSSSASSVDVHACSVSYGADELLLVAKAFMKVPCDAKHSADRKAEKFWEEVSSAFEEYVSTANQPMQQKQRIARRLQI